MNPYSIKKIINKKVRIKPYNAHLPDKKCCLPIFIHSCNLINVILISFKSNIMQKRHNTRLRDGEPDPKVSIGLFFILLGAALLIVTNDMLNLGSIHAYFTWQSILIFLGVVLVINRKFALGILFIATGTWFLLDEIYFTLPELIRILYWPAVIILVGFIFIITAMIKRNRTKNL
jgi:hypothetical protein